MVRSAPDAYSYKKWGILSQIDDPAEMASRILSGVSWIRTGDVIYYDDQSQGLGNHILSGSGGVGYSEALVTDCWVHGGKSILLTTKTAAGATCSIQYAVPHAGGGRVGFECNYRVGSGVKTLQVHLDMLRAGVERYARLRYDAYDYTLAYGLIDDGWVTLASNIPNPGVALPLSYLKLAIDATEGLWIGVWHNGVYYNLSTAVLEDWGAVERTLIIASIIVTADAYGPGYVWIDKVVMTQNEL